MSQFFSFHDLLLFEVDLKLMQKKLDMCHLQRVLHEDRMQEEDHLYRAGRAGVLTQRPGVPQCE